MFKRKKPTIIKKNIKIGETEITAIYYPHTGLFQFGDGVLGKNKAPKDYFDKTGAGAFKTMNALTKVFKEIAPKEIHYTVVADTDKETGIKDKLFARQLNKLGYTLEDSYKNPPIGSKIGYAPERKWVKKNNNNLERAVDSIIGISALTLSLLFLSPTLTGNAIANLTNQTSSIIGAGLFIVGIIGSYFWFKNK